MRYSQIKGLLFLIAFFFYVDVDAQVIRTVAGNGTIATSATDGNGGAAINSPTTTPHGVAVDRKGNMYVSDQFYNTVRKIRKDGLILPYAGNGNIGYSGNGGPASLAMLNTPSGLICDSIGNLYIADAGNFVVRKVDTFGIITLVAGVPGGISTSGDGGPATNAHIGACSGVALDAAGNIYIANGNDRVWKVTRSTGIINKVAGGTIGFSGNGGQATAAAMEGVVDVTLDAAGNFYISEQVNHCIRKISIATGVITAFAGQGTLIGTVGDGGLATAAKLNSPAGIKFDADGNLCICDAGNNRIRRVSAATGIISTLAGPATGFASGYAGDGTAVSAGLVRFLSPTSLSFDAKWHLFVTDKGPGNFGTGIGRRVREIYKIDTFQVVASPGNNLCSSDTVNFTANVTGFYYNFQYNWKVNGVAAGTNSPSFHPATISNNDRVTCTLTDTALGGLLLAVSDTVVMHIQPLVTPSITITASVDTVCAGTAVTLTSVITNGGSAPVYQWQVDGVNVGTGTSYSYTPANGDTVKAILTSSEVCVTSATATAAKRLTVNPMPFAGTLSGPTFICAGTSASLITTGDAGGTWSASNANATVSATGVVSGVTAGIDTISYRVTTATCGNAVATRVDTVGATPVAGTVVGLTTVCPGSAISLTNTATGGTWSASNANATVSATGVLMGVSSGQDTIYYTVTNACGTAIAQHIVTVGVSSLHDAGTILGAATACAGTTVALTDTATGGFWGSSNNAVAAVSATGTVSAVAGGVDTIFYVVASGCTPDTAFHAITVIPILSADTIAGASGGCAGSSITLASAATGGTWSSTNTTVATVDAAGHVTTLAPGITVIRYGVGNSCGGDTAAHTVTVAPVPFADTITDGTSFLCVGSTTTLTDTATGGVWSSSAPAVATVDATGFVASLSAGTTVISYTVTNSCGVDVATRSITVNAFPVLTSTTTPPAICSGSLFNYTPTSSTAGATFNWTRLAVPGILNPAASAAGDPNEILINTDVATVNVVYIFAVASGGCSTIQNVTVPVKPVPRLAGSDTVTTCAGRTFSYVAASSTPGTSYTWTRAAVSGVTPATGSGIGDINETLSTGSTTPVNVIYSFTLTAGGCINYENLTVVIQPQGPPPPAITTMSPSWLCKNTMYQNFGTSSVPDASVTYEWTASNAEVWAQGSNHQYSLVNFTSAGYATIYLSSSVTGFSCKSRDSFTVYVDNVNENVSVNYFDGIFSAQEGMSTYQWGYDDRATLDSAVIVGATAQNYAESAPDFANKYYWVMTEHQFCKQKSYYSVPTAVANVAAGGITQVTVFPNPTTGTFTINVASDFNEEGTITVTNMVGSKVLEQTCTTNSKMVMSIDQPSGIYFVTVNTPHGKNVTKVMVSRQ